MWRYAYNSPNDIIVSENIEENVIIQYYTNDTKIEQEDKDKPYYNPDVAKFVDQELVEQAQKEEEEKIELKKQQEEIREQQEAQKAQEFKFTDEHLQKLERNLILTNEQKEAINTLNDYNTQIVKLLREALNTQGATVNELEEKLNAIMRKEKELAQNKLADIISEDRTGNKILQVFEAITASELDDKDFDFLQQKKSIIFADFFVGSTTSNLEQATYIVERGKTEKELECINEKIANVKGYDAELMKLKVISIYEKAMLDNYYRARTTIKDDYFKDPEAKAKLSNEVIVLVTNMLPNQAIKLFNKMNTMTIAQRNELDAIMRLLTPQQQTTVENAIAKIPDGRTRKTAQKLFKEISK